MRRADATALADTPGVSLAAPDSLPGAQPFCTSAASLAPAIRFPTPLDPRPSTIDWPPLHVSWCSLLLSAVALARALFVLSLMLLPLLLLLLHCHSYLALFQPGLELFIRNSAGALPIVGGKNGRGILDGVRHVVLAEPLQRASDEVIDLPAFQNRSVSPCLQISSAYIISGRLWRKASGTRSGQGTPRIE